MKYIGWRLMHGLAALSVILLATPTVAGESTNYPNRPIRMLVPFAPGGASDSVGRIMQPALSQALKQQIVIDNRTGAAGNIAVEIVARATPDGYTLLLGNIGTMAINPSLYPTFPIRPLRDLIAITEVVDVPSLIVSHPSFPASSLKYFISYVKAHPGKVNFGSSGAGSANRLEMESFKRKAGLDMTHVPYKGGGPAIIALLGNEIQVMVATFPSAINFVKQGRMKAFAVTAKHRVAVLPEVPTMPELGFASMSNGSWQGVLVSKGTPAAIVQRLFEATIKVMHDPNVRKRLGDDGVHVVVSKSPKEFSEFIESENERFGTVIREAGITADS